MLKIPHGRSLRFACRFAPAGARDFRGPTRARNSKPAVGPHRLRTRWTPATLSITGHVANSAEQHLITPPGVHLPEALRFRRLRHGTLFALGATLVSWPPTHEERRVISPPRFHV